MNTTLTNWWIAPITPFCFNPRSREGSDHPGRQNSLWQSCVSIHAPVKGATIKPFEVQRRFYGFNPRSREGSDIQILCIQFVRTCFNPRSREGSDLGLVNVPVCICDVSIHAPVKGATSHGQSILSILSCFNPRSREGSDQDKGDQIYP